MTREIAVTYNVDGEDIKLTPAIVKDYLAAGAEITLPEFKMFSSLCKARGLNPFLKEAYIIKYGNNPAQIVVGKDAILKRAILNKNFNGREQGVIALKEDGQVLHKEGTFLLASETLVGGWAKVYRKDWEYPVYITVSFDEVSQKKRDGQLNKQWETKGATMVEKVALVRALREAFIEDVGGMYDEDEMPEVQQQDNVMEAEVIVQEDSFSADESDPSETISLDDV